MFAFSQSQASSAAATASPASSYQGEGASPAISPASPGARKRQIAHDDRELSEIKRRMWGLRVHCDAEAAGGVGPAALGALGAVPEAAVEEEEEAMDSDASDGQAAGGGGEEDGDGDGTPMVRSDSQGSSVSSASSSSSSGRGGSGRIGGDDPRALMLQALYQRRREPHEDKVEAKIESLIRASLRRATAASSDGLPLALCDAPWREVEDRRGGSGLGLGLGLGEGGDMDTSPDPSDSLPEVPASPLLGGFAGSVGDDDGGGMDL